MFLRNENDTEIAEYVLNRNDREHTPNDQKILLKKQIFEK